MAVCGVCIVVSDFQAAEVVSPPACSHFVINHQHSAMTRRVLLLGLPVFQVVLRSAWLCWQEWVQLTSEVKDRRRTRTLRAVVRHWRLTAKAAEKR
jgi:hypothetical protein